MSMVKMCTRTVFQQSVQVNSLTGSLQNAYSDQYNLKRTAIFTGY